VVAEPQARTAAWGLLVVDNATSHPEQMAPFVALVSADAEFSTSLVPVGNGEFLAVRSLE
jgi:predicted O-methyltransferase YrrM